MNLALVDTTDPEVASTSVGCLDDENTVCIAGEVDEKNY